VNHDTAQHVVEIEVKDTGLGLTDDDISHVFDRFFRVDKTGNGVIARDMIGHLCLFKCEYGSTSSLRTVLFYFTKRRRGSVWLI
jgi:signal transduction histidine kinase